MHSERILGSVSPDIQAVQEKTSWEELVQNAADTLEWLDENLEAIFQHALQLA